MASEVVAGRMEKKEQMPERSIMKTLVALERLERGMRGFILSEKERMLKEGEKKMREYIDTLKDLEKLGDELCLVESLLRELLTEVTRGKIRLERMVKTAESPEVGINLGIKYVLLTLPIREITNVIIELYGSKDKKQKKLGERLDTFLEIVQGYREIRGSVPEIPSDTVERLWFLAFIDFKMERAEKAAEEARHLRMELAKLVEKLTSEFPTEISMYALRRRDDFEA